MNLIYAIILILLVTAIVSIFVRRVRHSDGKPTVDTSIITKIYGNVAVPDMQNKIEESLKNQNMLEEVICAVQNIFTEVCGDQAECVDEQKDADSGTFVLTFRIPGREEPMVFECEHLGTFDLYFQYTDEFHTEAEHDRWYPQYDHTMDKDHIREAIRTVRSLKASLEQPK